MTSSGNGSPHFDPEAVHGKYARERAKRMVEGRGVIRDLTGDGLFTTYLNDPYTPFTEREPLSDEVDVAIIGAGVAGLAMGARLREAGMERIRLIDRAGGVGGTGYRERYPGAV